MGRQSANADADTPEGSSGPASNGDEAFDRGDFSEAAGLYLDQLSSTGPEERGRLLHRAAASFWKAGDYRAAADTYRKAALFQKQAGDRAQESRELLGLGASFHGMGRMAEAYQVMHEALEAAEEVESAGSVIDATNWLGIISRSQEDYALAIEHHRRALRLARRSGDAGKESSALNSLGLAHHHLGDMEKALEYFRLALSIRRRIGDRWGVADSLSNRGTTLKELDRFDEALDCFRESLEIRREIGGGARLANVLNNLGNLLLRTGRAGDAVEMHREALRIRRGIPHKAGVAYSLLNLGEAWESRGHPDRSLLCLRASLRMQKSLELPDLQVETLSILSRVLASSGHTAEALDAAGEALNLSRDHYAARESKKLAQARALLETEHQAREARALRRKNAQLSQLSDMLEVKKQQLQLILDYVPAFIVFRDRKGRVARLNEYAAKLIGAEPRELVGEEYESLFGRIGLQVRDESEKVLAQRRPVLELERRVDADNGARHYLVHVVPFDDPRGGSAGVVVFAVDVTAEREAENKRRELRGYRERAKRLDSLSHLAGTIAHDFNNLLLGIMGNVELASMKMPDSAASENLRTALESSHRAAGLCRQMLAFSGKGKFVTRKVDITEAVAAALEADSFPVRNIELESAGRLPPVELDMGQLRQAVENMVDEALRRGVNREDLLLRTGVCRSTGSGGDRDPDSDDGEDIYVYVELICGGLRMEAGQARRLLEPFLDGEDSTMRLDMPAVAGIVRAHGGYVDIDVGRESGVAIRLCFPASGELSPCVMEPSASPLHPKGGGMVLIVDDEATVRQTAREMIERLGYQAITCPGGNEALELLSSAGKSVSCVLLDLTMPGMSGQEALDRISREHPGVRVLLSSGFSRSSASDTMRNPSCCGFLQKPYSSSELEEMLRRVMP